MCVQLSICACRLWGDVHDGLGVARYMCVPVWRKWQSNGICACKPQYVQIMCAHPEKWSRAFSRWLRNEPSAEKAS